MDKIKICHICTLGMNGIGVFVCNLLENTDYKKYDVTVINFKDVDSEILSETIISRLEKYPVQIINHPTQNKLDYCIFLNKLFKCYKFDVCYSHFGGWSGIFSLIAYYNRIPVRAVHSHTSRMSVNNSKLQLPYRILRNILKHLVKVYANRYVACSEEAARWLFFPTIISKKQYFIVPNGIDLEKFLPSDRVKQESKEILFVGRLSPEKNPVFAIQVFSKYLKKDPTAHMTMIGKGRLDDDVRTEINRLNLSKHVDLVPETGDMPKYYQAADLLLFPSLYEGLGMVLIEAQASGLKCLASDAVPRLSQCGLVDYKSLADGPEAWAEYMSQLLQNDSLKIDQEKLKLFDIKNTVRMIDEVYGL